jgi:hypothetical protein
VVPFVEHRLDPVVHPMTVRVQERKVAHLRLTAGGQFGNRHGVMALDKAITERSIGCTKIQLACLTREPAVLSCCPVYSFLDRGSVLFARFMRPEQDAVLQGAFVRIIKFPLNLRLRVVSPYRVDHLSQARKVMGELIPHDVVKT